MVQPTDPRESLSKLLFNAQHRLAIASAFASSGEPLRYDDIVTRTGVSRSVVHKEVQVLTAIGAVQRVDVERAVYFQRTKSAYWVLCTELVARSSSSAHIS